MRPAQSYFYWMAFLLISSSHIVFLVHWIALGEIEPWKSLVVGDRGVGGSTSIPHHYQHVIDLSGIEGLHQIFRGFFDKNSTTFGLCSILDQARVHHPHAILRVNVTFGCQELYDHGRYGTGNYLEMIYSARLVAAVSHNVTLSLSCTDAMDTLQHLILPHIIGRFGAADRIPREVQPAFACRSNERSPIGYLHYAMRHELRRMASRLVGSKFVTSNESMKSLGSLQYQLPDKLKAVPLLSNIELDDAVVHFRCGDLIQSNHPGFVFQKFSTLSQWISQNAKSIGIVTQSFESSVQARGVDSTQVSRRRCRMVVESFRDFLTMKFPKASIQIRNGKQETIALAFARLILANQTIVGSSTFGVFPAIASFGTGYIRRPSLNREPNRWLLIPAIDRLVNDTVLYEDVNVLPVKTIHDMWIRDADAVLKWFWS